MLDINELEARVKEMAIETFSAEAIRDVRCHRDEEHVYGPVVWVHFVVADGKMPFEPDVSLTFGVRLRLAFDDWGETAIPVTSFYPESEYKALYPAAA